MAKKIRVNWTIDPRAEDILTKAARYKGLSKSRIVEELIFQKLANPIETLKQEKRELAKRMNAIDKRIEDLEEIKSPPP